MKINGRTASDITFTVYDEVTDKKFGGKVGFGGHYLDYTKPNQIHFSYIGELEETIKLLTDMYEMAIEQRRIHYRIEEPHVIKENDYD
jgi:hypothetical protein